MNSDGNRFLKPVGARLPAHSGIVRAVCLLLSVFWLLISAAHAATFPGIARVEVTDSSGGLSWNTANSALTIQCWFKISIPSGTNLTENMTILANRRTGTTNDAHAFLIEYDIYSGNVEFSTKGTGFRRFSLVERPFLDRWYHVAVVRQNEQFDAFVDGRVISVPVGAAVGDARSTDGVSIGGWGSGKYHFGEVQEVSIYQTALSQDFIVQNMFASQPAIPELKGYFKLGFSTNTADNLKNFAPTPVPSGTEAGIAQGAGTITFEESNQAGEQSAFDSRRNGGRDAVTPLSGSFSWGQTALACPTPGVAFDLSFGYSSANAAGGTKLGGTDPYAAGPLGKGWRHTFETRAIPAQTFSPLADTDTLGLMMWNGAIETWDLDYSSGQYRPRDNEYKGELLLTTTNCQWTTPERLLYVFKRPDSGGAVMRGRLTAIRDFNGNNVQVLWNETSGIITQLVDSASGRYNLSYGAGLLTNITFGAWLVRFNYDATNRLVSKSITNTSGVYSNVNSTVWQFSYNTNGLLGSILDPRGYTNVLIQYDEYGRKTNEVDALNRATQTRYGVSGKRQITRIDPGTNSWIETYDRKGHITAQQDPLTNITGYAYDTNGNRISITEPLGWKTTFGYDSRANVIARTNALGETTRWGFHPFFNKATNEVNAAGWTNSYVLDNATGNLLRHYDDLGTLVAYTYRTNGLVDTSTDANGGITRFDYNTNGFLTSRLDPGTNLWTYAPNEVGWKTSEANPLGEVSTYSHDLNGNVVLAIDPLFRHFTKTHDANGNVLSESDGKSQLTTYAYDGANQRTNLVDRTGTNVWRFTYTSRGKLAATTDPQTNTVTQTYDAANRLVSVTDPLGGSITNVYDANGNSTVLIDKLGQRWTKTYDRLNRVIAEANPQGDTRQTAYDQVGRISVVTTPNGYPSTHTYDGRGRLTKWKDAEGFEWLYDYDGNANITNITDALLGHYVMTYGPRNERLTELNQDSNQWTYAYDELARLKQQTDPNGTSRTLEYDPGGRVLSVQFSTGRKNSMVYDDNNNVRILTRRVGLQNTTTQLAYDALDRVVEQTDAFLQTVRYGYDSLGRIATLTYPGNKVLAQKFDPLGRLTNQVDWAGRQMNYDYDKAGRLIRRTYPNGVVQTNAFDTAGRITDLKYQISNPQSNSIAIALAYAYDRNGNKTGGGEKGTFQWPLPTLTDETSRFTPAGKLIDRNVQNTASNQLSTINYAYDASGNMTNTKGAGQIWALTYDEDNRVTSIGWTNGALNDKFITNRYDALGRRIAKKVDGEETRYVLDLTGGMERILCDTTSSGQITAWYIHGPDLAYKVDATNGIVCFHADAQANVIALTDAGGTTVAQYAYTPYGRSLGSTDLPSQISNPYRFVGSQGVMEESDIPNLYFMRARYYSADAGVFLSTDSVKKIGPRWKPVAFGYGGANPINYIDPSGEVIDPVTLSIGAAFVLGVASEAIPKFLEPDVPDPEYLTGTYTEAAVFFGAPDPWSKAFLAGRLITRGALAYNDIAQNLPSGGKGSSGAKVSAKDGISQATSGVSPQAFKQNLRQSPQAQQLVGNFQSAQNGINQSVNQLWNHFEAVYGNNSNGKINATVNAGSYGQKVTDQTKTQVAPGSNGTGTTTQNNSSGGSSSGGGGNNAFSRITQSQTYQNVSSAVRNVTTTVGQALTTAVQTVSSWASSAWNFLAGRWP